MKLPRMPHDAFVKRMLSDGLVAQDFFKRRLPRRFVRRLQLSTLELQSSEFVTATLKSRVNDMLFRVRCLNPEGDIYLLVEHQRTADPLMAWRLQYYHAQLIDRYLRWQRKRKQPMLPLPFIYQVVLYNGKRPLQLSQDIGQLFGPFATLAKEYRQLQVIDFNLISDEEIIKDGWAGPVEWGLKHSIERDFLPALPFFLRVMQQLERSTPEMELRRDSVLESMLEYMIKGMATSQHVEQIRDALSAVRAEMPSQGEKNMPTIAEQFWKEGKKEGREEGIEQGIEQGIEMTLKAATLLREGQAVEKVSQITGLNAVTLFSLYQQLKP